MSQAGIESQQVSLFAQQSLFSVAVTSEQVATAAPTMTMDTLLEDAVFTVMDLETTGLNKSKNAITEVAAIQYRQGQELGSYMTLVRPTEEIPEEIEQFTGITNEMVKNSPALVMVLSDLSAFIGESPVIVGHNINFDIQFVREKFNQNGMAMFCDRVDSSRSLCTKILAQKAMPGLPSYEGIVVATSCGVVNPNPHRAENDVRMSAEILFALIKRIQESNPSIKTIGDLIRYQMG